MSNASTHNLQNLRRESDRLAAYLPHASSRDDALRVAIRAAETAFKALKLTDDAAQKQQYTARARQLTADAERIKRSADWRSTIRNLPTVASASCSLLAPEDDRTLSTREEIILLKAGFLNGVKFPRWEAPPLPSEFDLKDGEDLFLYVSLPCRLSSPTSH